MYYALTQRHSATLRPQLQSALQQVFWGIAARAPLLLAIDDADAIDEPSTATIGLLAQQIRDTPLVILATAVRDATPNAASTFKLFADKASKVKLQNLTHDEAQLLLVSVFGASLTLEALTQRLRTLTAGSPRDLMRLAQHLVDSGSARYHAGAWSLPGGLDGSQFASQHSAAVVRSFAAVAALKYPFVLLNDSDRLRAWLSKNMWFLIDFHERDPIRVGSGGSDFDHVFSIVPVPNALSRNEGIFQVAAPRARFGTRARLMSRQKLQPRRVPTTV